MKRTTSLSPKQLLISVGLLICFCLAIFFLFFFRKDKRAFQKLTKNLFLQEMTSNTLNMHYTLADPASFGIPRTSPVLSCYREKGELSAAGELAEFLESLSVIDSDKLSAKEQTLYEQMQTYYRLSQKMAEYPYFEEPFSVHSGSQSQLPILLSEYTFRSKQDVEDYLCLLSQIDSVFQSYILYEREKMNANMGMSVQSLEQICGQCDTIVTLSAVKNQTHFLQDTFTKRLTGLRNQGLLTDRECDSYEEKHNDILATIVVPAYHNLKQELLALKPLCSSQTPKGLASFSGGEAYYSLLFQRETSTDRPLEEIIELLKERVQTDYREIRQLLALHPECKEAFRKEDFNHLPYRDAKTILKDLTDRCRESFPSLQTADGSPTVLVKTLSLGLTEYCAPAFYLTSPTDNTDTNVIYINSEKIPSDLDLYTTLAHEAYPGHLYQNVLTSRHLQNENPARLLLWYGGFLEGWALYVEFLSYDFAAQIKEEQGNATEAACVRLEQKNRDLQLCLYTLLDIAIHKDGADRQKVTEILAPFGITGEAVINSVYDYIAQNPCNYPKYYVGYLEFTLLKEQARKTWGNEYSDYRFHEFIQKNGPCDFQTLSRCLG